MQETPTPNREKDPLLTQLRERVMRPDLWFHTLTAAGLAGALYLIFSATAFATADEWTVLVGFLLALAGGALFALVGTPIWGILSSRFPSLSRATHHARFKPSTIKLKGLFEMEVSFDEPARRALWPIYVELTTRIATNSLILRGETLPESGEATGSLRAALNSLYSLFALVRKQLGAAYDDGFLLASHQPMETLPGTVIATLNVAIRPFLARWHPWLDQWEATGLPEARWPGFDACHQDLEAVREKTIELVNNLADAFGEKPIYTPQNLMTWTTRPDTLQPGWGPHDALLHQAYVATRATVPAEPLEAGAVHASTLVATLKSWRALAQQLDTLLAGATPIPAGAIGQPGERPDERILSLREPLERPLLRWSGRAQGWGASPDKAEVAACAADVEAVRVTLRALLAGWR